MPLPLTNTGVSLRSEWHAKGVIEINATCVYGFLVQPPTKRPMLLYTTCRNVFPTS
jgi:hypothetical protein